MAMFKYIGLLGAALAGFAYFFLQSTPVNFELKKFIRHEPSLVFKFLKDPNYLTDIHPKVCVFFVNKVHFRSSLPVNIA